MKRLLLLPLIWPIAHFCQTQTDGFSLSKVAAYLPGGADPLPLPVEVNLDQPFTYHAKGGQCYVFTSEDGDTVLKLFRSSRLSLFSTFPKLFPQGLARERAKLQETLDSVHLAATALSEETGVLFAHLKTKSAGPSHLKIIDKLGSAHTIDAMKTPYLIQRRAVPVKEALLKWKESGDIESAKEGILSLAALIQKERDKKIGDGDPNLSKNFGFCSGLAIQIDVGRFGKSADLAASKEDMQHFINAHIPELSDFFHAAFQPLIDSYDSSPIFSGR